MVGLVDGIFFLQVGINGILLGGIYGLLGLGLSLNLGLLNGINLAHGSLLIAAAVVSYILSDRLGFPPLANLFFVPLLFAGLGRVTYPLMVAPLARREPKRSLVSFLLITLGAAFLLEELSALVLVHPLIGLHSGWSTQQFRGLVFSPLSLIVLLVWVILVFLLTVGLYRTDSGRILRALPQDREGALLVGIPLETTQARAWSLGWAAAALAGVFWVCLYPVTPFSGLKLTTSALLMVMAVGPGEVIGVLGVGLFWGFMESVGGMVVGQRWGTLIPLSVILGWVGFFPRGMGFWRKEG